MHVRYAGVSHVSFSVPDLNRSKRWYAELFRWEEVMTGEGGLVSDLLADCQCALRARPQLLRSRWDRTLSSS